MMYMNIQSLKMLQPFDHPIWSSFRSQPSLKSGLSGRQKKNKQKKKNPKMWPCDCNIWFVTDAISRWLVNNLMPWQPISLPSSVSIIMYIRRWYSKSLGTLSNSFFSSGECICEHINCPILQILLQKTSKQTSNVSIIMFLSLW